jgi:hypothetical protein
MRKEDLSEGSIGLISKTWRLPEIQRGKDRSTPTIDTSWVESQRDSVTKPRVARIALPWVNVLISPTLNGLSLPKVNINQDD